MLRVKRARVGQIKAFMEALGSKRPNDKKEDNWPNLQEASQLSQFKLNHPPITSQALITKKIQKKKYISALDLIFKVQNELKGHALSETKIVQGLIRQYEVHDIAIWRMMHLNLEEQLSSCDIDSDLIQEISECNFIYTSKECYQQQIEEVNCAIVDKIVQPRD